MKRTVVKSGNTDKNNGGLKASVAFDVIMAVVNQPRPYEYSDFVKEYYFPDI